MLSQLTSRLAVLPKRQAWQLFLATVFPVQFWAILIFILNAPNPKNANDWGEALAIGSYILLFALLESAGIWLGLLLLGLLLPRRWTSEQRFGVLVALLAVFIGWALVAQLASLIRIPPTPFFIYIGINLANTLLYRQLAYIGIVVLVLLSVLAALWLGSSVRIQRGVRTIVERLEVLSILYLLLDGLALIFAITRNT